MVQFTAARFGVNDIANKEGLSIDYTVQLIWDTYATENVRAHEQDMKKELINSISAMNMAEVTEAISGYRTTKALNIATESLNIKVS